MGILFVNTCNICSYQGDGLDRRF